MLQWMGDLLIPCGPPNLIYWDGKEMAMMEVDRDGTIYASPFHQRMLIRSMWGV